jgi:transposase-like protein
MSSKHSAEFKANIALEAIKLPVEELDAFAEKHGVTKTEVLEWVSALKAKSANIFEGSADSHGGHHHAVGEDVELKTQDEELAQAVDFGVHNDDLNYKSLTFWTTFGTVLVIVIIIGLIQFGKDSYFKAQQKASFNSGETEIDEIKAKDAETLNSYGVVDLENGVYRIPVDKAIDKIAVD